MNKVNVTCNYSIGYKGIYTNNLLLESKLITHVFNTTSLHMTSVLLLEQCLRERNCKILFYNYKFYLLLVLTIGSAIVRIYLGLDNIVVLKGSKDRKSVV